MTTTTALEHQTYCLPRPGNDAPRVESYRLPRWSDDGVTQVGSVTVVRCTECGRATYDGVLDRAS